MVALVPNNPGVEALPAQTLVRPVIGDALGAGLHAADQRRLPPAQPTTDSVQTIIPIVLTVDPADSINYNVVTTTT